MVFGYKIHLKNSGYSPSTINRRLAALRSITKLARQFGVMDWRLEVDGEQSRSFKDTAGCGIDGFRKLVETLEREIADNAEIDKPRAAARRWRDRALLIVMYYGALRRMEPLTTRYPDDLRFSKQRDGIPELQILGKKRGEREWVPIGHTAWAAIQDWLKHRGTKKGPLFPGLDPDNMLTTRTVNNMLERLSSASGVDVTPHGLRHTAITELLERTNGDVRMAQRFARHQNAATTMLYDDNRQHLAARGVRALEDELAPEEAHKKTVRK
jgi:integrase/recombinase XerC